MATVQQLTGIEIMGVDVPSMLVRCPECNLRMGVKKWQAGHDAVNNTIKCPSCDMIVGCEGVLECEQFAPAPAPEPIAETEPAGPASAVVVNPDGTKTYREVVNVTVSAKAKGGDQ